jgi:hypothetical protein
MTEGEYLEIVDRTQRAMLGDRNVLQQLVLLDLPRLMLERLEHIAEIRRLLADNAELSTECDQYQAKLNEVWAEVAELRARA